MYPESAFPTDSVIRHPVCEGYAKPLSISRQAVNSMIVSLESRGQRPIVAAMAPSVHMHLSFQCGARSLYLRSVEVEESEYLPYWAFSVRCVDRTYLFDLRTGKEVT